VARKARAAFRDGLTPIVCVGETLAEREADRTTEVLVRQVRAVYEGLSESEARGSVIAYEPVWRSARGRWRARRRRARRTRWCARRWTASSHPGVGQSLAILYGGSVTEQNAVALFAEPELTGWSAGPRSRPPGSGGSAPRPRHAEERAAPRVRWTPHGPAASLAGRFATGAAAARPRPLAPRSSEGCHVRSAARGPHRHLSQPVIVVLLQSGKGGGLAGGAFGATAQTVFGGRGATDFMTRATMVLGGAFFITSLVLALMSSGVGSSARSLIQENARRAPATARRCRAPSRPASGPGLDDAAGESPAGSADSARR